MIDVSRFLLYASTPYLGTQLYMFSTDLLPVFNTYSNFLCLLGHVPNSMYMCSLQSLSDLPLTHINVYALIFLSFESIFQIDFSICFLQIYYLPLAHTVFCIVYMLFTASFGSVCSTYNVSIMYLFLDSWYTNYFC